MQVGHEFADADRMSDRFAVVLKEAVCAERGRLNITQQALADRMGWSRGQVTCVESGARRIHAHELPDLCRALEVRLSDLIGRASPEDRYWLS
ncbi:MAG: helix-turn-helix transcriptional regulator [Actinomycetota bacterium]|nr:helix-turn-helix transcriptional regulator [Actinomycetota bacterium]